MKNNNSDRYILLSIQPRYAEKIFNGTKKVELRRSFPVSYENRLVVVYVSTPVKAIIGTFHISSVLSAKPEEIWKAAGKVSGINRDEFDTYYDGAETGHAIFIRNVRRCEKPIPLNTLRLQIDKFTAPQNFRYICSKYADSIQVSD